jgi:hypothetical protein
MRKKTAGRGGGGEAYYLLSGPQEDETVEQRQFRRFNALTSREEKLAVLFHSFTCFLISSIDIKTIFLGDLLEEPEFEADVG